MPHQPPGARARHRPRLARLLRGHRGDAGVGVVPADRRGDRGPVTAQEGADVRLRLDGRAGRLLHGVRRRRPLGARRAAAVRRQSLSRVVDGHLRLDPGRHRRARRPRRPLVARLGLRLSGRLRPAGNQPRRRHRARRARPQPGHRRTPESAQRRVVVGVVHLRPVRPAQEPATGQRRRGRQRESGPAELRATVRDAPARPDLSDDAAVPGRVPVLQRRDPDRHRGLLDVWREAARVRDPGADHDDPAGPVHRVLRRDRPSAGSPAGTGPGARSWAGW